MKALANPSGGIVLTGNVVLSLFGERMSFDEAKKDGMWKKCTNFMGNPDAFIAKIRNFRGEDIPPEILNAVSPIVDDPEK